MFWETFFVFVFISGVDSDGRTGLIGVGMSKKSQLLTVSDKCVWVKMSCGRTGRGPRTQGMDFRTQTVPSPQGYQTLREARTFEP